MVRISVTVADFLPDDVYYTIGHALEDTATDHIVYRGIPKPSGEIVSSPYVEARNRLLTSQAVFLVLCRDDNGHIVDDWTLPLLPALRERNVEVFAYLLKTTHPGANSSPASVLVEADAHVRLVATFDDVAPAVITDLEKLSDPKR